MARRRLDLRFPPNRATRPVTYHLVKDYDLTPNILRAHIEPGQQGRMLVEVTGKKEDIDAAVAFLGKEGIRSRPRRATSSSTRSGAWCAACAPPCASPRR